MNIQRKSLDFLAEDDMLFRRGFNQALLRYIAGDKVTRVLEEVHSGECGRHQAGSRLFKQIVHIGYHWPTIEADAVFFA